MDRPASRCLLVMNLLLLLLLVVPQCVCVCVCVCVCLFECLLFSKGAQLGNLSRCSLTRQPRSDSVVALIVT